MKKLFYVATLVLTIGLITGCGAKEKKLVCTFEQDTNDLKNKAQITAKWEGTKLKNVDMEITFKPNSETVKNNWEYFSETLTERLNDTYAESKGIDINSDATDNQYVYTIKIDLDKATDEGLEEIGLGSVEGTDTSYKTAKAEFEEQGYTCK